MIRRPNRGAGCIAPSTGSPAVKSETEAAGLALLPDFSIALTGGRLADPLLTLLRLNPWLATAAIGAAVPIYEGGALEAQVRIATARQAQAVARYGSVVLRAFPRGGDRPRQRAPAGQDARCSMKAR